MWFWAADGRGVTLEKPRDVRNRLKSFTTKPVDWRWEVIEDAVSDELRLYDSYAECYSQEVLQKDTALNAVVKEGLYDPLHVFISLVLQWASKAVGTSS